MSRFDIAQLDDLIHGRLRLGIMKHLAATGSADFTQLRDLLGATNGNLSAHLARLEAAGYVTVDKSFQNRRPLTRVALTQAGRSAFEGYLSVIGKLVGEG